MTDQKTTKRSVLRRRAPATGIDQREKQMVSMAIDLAEKRLMDGTASNMLVLHYLKLASSREDLEREKLKKEIALLEAKKVATDSSAHMEELYTNAINAMTRYGASINHIGDEDYEDI